MQEKGLVDALVVAVTYPVTYLIGLINGLIMYPVAVLNAFFNGELL